MHVCIRSHWKITRLTHGMENSAKKLASIFFARVRVSVCVCGKLNQDRPFPKILSRFILPNVFK